MEPHEIEDTIHPNLVTSRGAFDLYFLAMCHWRLGKVADARTCFDRAERWVQEHQATLSPQQRAELQLFSGLSADLNRSCSFRL